MPSWPSYLEQKSHTDFNIWSLHTHKCSFVLKWRHFTSEPHWTLTSIIISSHLCQISPLNAPALVSSSDTFLFRHRHGGGGGGRLSGARREDQIYLFEQPLCWLFDLSFCLVWAPLPLRLPYPCFSLLQLYSTTSNGMAYLIRYAWAVSLIEAACLPLSVSPSL